ncbi:histidine phosphatase family protein [Rhizobium sp. L1K21]|uniref:histidine phosphatase family protein n=1 Tax=Rhizobium sp. L1K21 TaxID=2954933 RepID=UPI002093095B|nr:histidine phosphatase family protein [Rhizobium sp. L1K21]MCO6187839.1 histidine phosphatase family protein [Rhizobium sp. L1K21]
MTTTFLLVRHAAHDDLGRLLTGRAGDIALNATGRQQAQKLGVRLQREKLSAIYSSPQRRAQETAAEIASVCDCGPVETSADIDEIDFGSWAGESFDTLAGDPDWQKWNSLRSETCPPNGESMQDVQRRVKAFLEAQIAARKDQTVALVSHADVIKAAVIDAMDIHIDDWSAFDIAPASITSLVAGDWGARIFTLNETLE